ncbi:hypothetical protein [uncultured Pontibacter sp.]|nr:hypothetical protein [uncultured Pontibacter sp.]
MLKIKSHLYFPASALMPKSNASGNIRNGAIGYFGASAVPVIEKVVE